MRTVLAVDDEPQLLRALRFTLEIEGYRVLTAENITEALDSLAKEQVDVILTDYRMPGGTGIDLIQQVKEARSNPPTFILMTGISDLSVNEAKSSGFIRVLPKPFELDDLIQAVGT